MANFLDPSGLNYFFQKLKNIFALRSQQLSTIAHLNVNESTGSMELWSKDLNTITTSGFYNAMTCSNAKYSYSTLIVIGYYLGGYCTQIQCDVTSGAIATRSQIGGSWTAWKVISTK